MFRDLRERVVDSLVRDFTELVHEGFLTLDDIDSMTLLRLIYEPILVLMLLNFKNWWNSEHTIRKQKNRPYLPSGRPEIHRTFDTW